MKILGDFSMIVQGLKKTYRTSNQNTVLALNDVSFILPDKGMVFLLGKSGSGKSTLLNVLSGLDSFDEGSVEVNGKNLKDYSRKELDEYRNYECGIVFQEYNLLPELNVKDNIALSLEFQGKNEIQEKVKNALDQVELSGYENRKVKELSGGQKQRVAIARAIVKDPEIIFADEPTGALDEETGKGILSLLKGLSSDRLVVVVTHDEDFAREFGDRIIELSDGKVIKDTQPDYRSTCEVKQKEYQTKKFSVLSALKIGCSNYLHHPIRVFATLILAVISFALFGISLTFSLADPYAVFAEAMYDNVQTTIIYKVQTTKPKGLYGTFLDELIGDPGWNPREINLEDADIQELEKLAKMPIVKAGGPKGYIFTFQKVIADMNKIHLERELNCAITAGGYIVIDENVVENYHLNLVGKLPQSPKEIVINESMLNSYIVGGLIDGGETYQIHSAEDILGHRIPISEYTVDLTNLFTITGVIDTGCKFDCEEEHGKLSFHDKIFVNNDYFLEENYAICPINPDRDTFMNFAKSLLEDRQYARVHYTKQPTAYEFSNSLSRRYYTATGIMAGDKNTYLYMGIFFFIIAFVFLMNFIAVSVRKQMKEIGILSSLGADFKKIYFIYFLGALLLCGSVFALSSIAVLIGSMMMMNHYVKTYNLISSPLGFNPVYLPVLLALAILTAILGSLLPLLKMRKMSSAEIIRKGQIK